MRLFILDSESSEISINIAYTELTWGIDVLRHLEGDVHNKFIYENKIITTVRSIISFATFAVVPFTILIPFFLYGLLSDDVKSHDKLDFMSSIVSETDPHKSIIRRLDYLITDHGSNPLQDVRFWLYMTAILLVVAAMALFVLRRPKSYLILNAASEKYKKLSERRRRALESGAVVTVILGIISELIGAHLSEWINRLL